jgi:hypothetical protein
MLTFDAAIASDTDVSLRVVPLISIGPYLRWQVPDIVVLLRMPPQLRAIRSTSVNLQSYPLS